jgi:hypothetical protein
MDKLTATVHHLAAESVVSDLRVRPFAVEIWRCVELINRTHHGLDLFRPYGIEFLRGRLDDLFWSKPPFIPSVYGWDEIRPRGGRQIVAAVVSGIVGVTYQYWRHRETGEERLLDVTCLMDFGFAEGRADAMAA